MIDTELGYFTLNEALKCVSYRLSKPRLNFLSLVFGQCADPVQGEDSPDHHGPASLLVVDILYIDIEG